MQLVDPTSPAFLFIFVLIGVPFVAGVLYLFWCAVAMRWHRVGWYNLALYMSVGFLVAVYTESIHDYVYRAFTGQFLWIYHVWPIFGGASSGLAFVTWPFYGFHAYFLIKTLDRYSVRLPTWGKGLLSAIDGVPFDMLANAGAQFFFGVYFFFYPRDVLWHLSDWWVMPFYAVSGIIYAYALHLLFAQPRDWRIPAVCYALGVAGMLIGEYYFIRFA